LAQRREKKGAGGNERSPRRKQNLKARHSACRSLPRVGLKNDSGRGRKQQGKSQQGLQPKSTYSLGPMDVQCRNIGGLEAGMCSLKEHCPPDKTRCSNCEARNAAIGWQLNYGDLTREGWAQKRSKGRSKRRRTSGEALTESITGPPQWRRGVSGRDPSKIVGVSSRRQLKGNLNRPNAAI